MDIATRKRRLRAIMLSQREKITTSELQKHSELICKRLWTIIVQQKVKKLHCFLPMGKEVNVSPLLDKALESSILVVAPKTLEKPRLQQLLLEDTKQLETGRFGTLHPRGGNKYDGNYDLILVPGLAFDHQNNRLGYGAGYYDYFLAQHPSVLKIGVSFAFQIVDSLPIEEHDVPLDLVISSGD